MPGTVPGRGSLRWGLLLLLGLLGCGRSEPGTDATVDPALLEAVPGLQPGDRVHVVVLAFGSSGEEVEPDSVLIRPGDWVDFRTEDGSPRQVTFFPDSTPSPNRTFLEERGFRASPPLVAPESHWVVSFDGAPAGPYPFRVEGGRAEGRGVVHVSPEG